MASLIRLISQHVDVYVYDTNFERNINKNTESIVNVMLSNKNIQKQLQKQIFMTIKDKLNMTKHD